MRIENTNRNAATDNLAQAVKPKSSTASPTPFGFAESEQLNQTLAAVPAVRADQVARAKALIADPNYPSNGQLDKLAGLLSEHLEK